jgi:hypothetical protein
VPCPLCHCIAGGSTAYRVDAVSDERTATNETNRLSKINHPSHLNGYRAQFSPCDMSNFTKITLNIQEFYCTFPPVENVCSLLFSLKIFIQNVFLGKKLMFILGYFRKNNPCGDSLVTRIYRRSHKPLTAQPTHLFNG